MSGMRAAETLHGTRDGRLRIDRALVERVGLTGREAQCATLLREGASIQAIADRLAISPSTAEKHVGGLRRKLGVESTLEAAVVLLHGAGPVRAPDARQTLPREPGFAVSPGRACASAGSMRGLLESALEALASDGVEALFYFFLPLAAKSLAGADVVSERVASGGVAWAFDASIAETARRLAPLFECAPEEGVVLDVGATSCARSRCVPACLAAACRAEGIGLVLGVEARCTTGRWVAIGLYRRSSAAVVRRDRRAMAARLRGQIQGAHDVAFADGALARLAGLTVRERDAMALVATGMTGREAAASLGTSERALQQVMRNAREKLGTKTTAGAIARAMALHALVFA